MSKEKKAGHLIMLVVTIIFGLNIPLSKSLLPQSISPEGLTLSRILFAAAAFWIASLFTAREKVPFKDHGFMLVGALCGVTFNQGLFVIGLNSTSPIDASIIITSGPLFAMIIAALILKEPITFLKVAGVLVGASGAILLVYSGRNGVQAHSGSLTGNLMILASAAIYAFYLVITKPLTLRYSPVTLMKWMFLYSAILLTPLFLKNIQEAPVVLQPSLKPVMQMFYTLFGATFITYLLIPMAQKRIRPTTISMYNNLQPLIASIATILVGMDRFSIVKLLAGLLIFTGVYLVTQSKSKEDMESEKIKPASESVLS